MNKKKLWGAILSALAFILYFGLLLAIFTVAGITTQDLPLPFFILVIFFLTIPLVGITVALILRIKEIKNGEEEEAKKY